MKNRWRPRRDRRQPAKREQGERRGAGREIVVRIERILPGGLGLAHAAEEGLPKTVLVALAAPGDLARVRVNDVRGAVAFASLLEIIEPSPARVEPLCLYFGRCGGCDFQQLNYEAQLAAKVEIVRDCLRRIARIEPPAEIPITPAPSAWHYRARARWQYAQDGQRFGYYERGSLEVCDVAHCPVVVPALEEKLERLREELRAGRLPNEAGEFQAVAGDGGAVALSPPLDERETAESFRTIGGERYRFGADCFFQINHELLEPLIAEALRGDEGGGTGAALDLYCGVGLFTLPLARRFRSVIGVEGNASACAYARRNLSDAGLSNARIETTGVGEWLTRRGEEFSDEGFDDAESSGLDFVLLDPPRAGAEREVVEGIIHRQPRRISYVSCDPATLARDLKMFLDADYQLDSVAAFDVFPQTHHVETVARLSLSQIT